MRDVGQLQCELVYGPKGALPMICILPWSPQLTVTAAIEASGWLQDCPEIRGLAVGIFASVVSPDTLVKPGDRIEIYRPLDADPKENRRTRIKR